MTGTIARAAEKRVNDPYYVGRDYPRLTTPQWVGEPGVEAVVILSIDDLRDTTSQPLSVGKYEAFLRPILNRLKQIDGTAPLSVMTCQVHPKNELLQTWLKEGVSLETHTIDHPCPLPLATDPLGSKSTFDRCVDLLNSVPGNRAVAFRMPCCDSINTPGAPFYEKIFSQKTANGAFLSIDSSVCNVTTSNDPALPKELVLDADGRERFRKYIPNPSFVNFVEDYPYPYVIGGVCWEFPCATPSDWQAQNLHKPNNPKTVEDWKALLDATVIKQGVMTIVFHPHGWIKSEQIVELIDHAVTNHGKKVKFLSFADAQRRLDKNFLGGRPLRNAEGESNGVRLADVNGDSLIDVLVDVDSKAKTKALSPEEGLKTFKVYPGFRIELAAAEPLVQDPVAFNWSADGRLWVVEMGDYPLGVDGTGEPGGVVRILEDTNADGRYDKSTVFLDKLSFPTGVTPWRKGVLITCAPDIFYAEDTDGDGKCDKREVLFTGFGEGNQQHRVNGLVYGLDNWFYGANGDSGGQIRSTRTGKVVDISGRDFRINPDAGEIDPQTGQTQHSRARDDWGNWFGGNNSNPCWQFVLDDRYIRRNPHVAAPQPWRDVPEAPGPAPVFPISKTAERFNEPHSVNRFTSACGLTFVRDELFGSGYRGNSFVAEPVHNLVHREVVWHDGLLVKSRRADDELRMEFIASSDNWFRPVFLRTGPDGALYIADMYRAVIEHPEWIPKQWQAKLDLRAGHDKGRIYRVFPGAKPLRPIPNLEKLDAAGLVAALESPGGWERDMAQQLIVERQDKTAVPLLEKVAGKSLRALARLHALCTLDGMNALTPAVLIRATQDQIPGVRAHTVRMSETKLKDSSQLAEAVLKLAKDPDPTVLFQLAYSLGEWNDPRAAEALATIALRDGRDAYVTAAVLSSVNASNVAAVIAGVTKDPNRKASPAVLSGLVQVAAALGNESALSAAVDSVAQSSSDPAKQFAALPGALDGIERSGKPAGNALDKLSGVFDAARETAIDDAASPEIRSAAVALLGRGKPEDREGDVELLGALLTPQTPEKVQSAVIVSLSRVANPAAAKALLGAWKEMTPGLRTETLGALLAQGAFASPLLDAIEEGKSIRASDIDAAHRRQLTEHADDAIRKRATKVFEGSVNPDRQKVIDQFSAALKLKGDPAKGREFFSAVCATCHKVGDLGVNVGPDLLSVADQSPEYLLLHILDPSRAVETKYTQYVAETKNGQTLTGVLSGETGKSVTLMGPGGQPQTVLRADLKRLRATPLSAMPDGVEVGRTPQDFADLIEFITRSRTEQKQ